ncbi:MAG: hypothetical protein B7733_07205 [Myxococcales bacterium FL481]|nr:MAG: hypothetical protein B7733_07205 [Myxococcales bacterium FL481]
MATAHQIISWVRDEGNVEAVNRLRLRVIKSLVRHKTTLEQLTPRTHADPELVAELRQAASEVVNKPCPV